MLHVAAMTHSLETADASLHELRIGQAHRRAAVIVHHLAAYDAAVRRHARIEGFLLADAMKENLRVRHEDP
jgi:hypothetical protein